MLHLVDLAGCAWCGGRPLTREHLVPQWLTQVLGETFPLDDGYRFAYTHATEAGEGPLRSFDQSAPTVVVRAVCEPCNGGWMSQLEEQAIPVVGPMVRGESFRLDMESQLTLTRWASKVVALLDHYEADSVGLGPAELDEIRSGGHAPGSFHIRLGYRSEDHPAPLDLFISSHYASLHTAADRDEDQSVPNSFSATLGLGRLAIAVVGGPGVSNPGRWAQGSDFPMMVWPPTPGGLEWPPAHPLLQNRDELREFHEGFWTHITNDDFPRPDALGRAARES